MTDTPPYLRIADELRARILDGGVVAGERLPSISELAEEFGYSGGVAQRAYGILIEENLVVARPGAGYFVQSQEAPQVLVRHQRVRPGQGSPVRVMLVEQGMDASRRSESATARADAVVAERLGIAAGEPVVHTAYVHLADGVPVQLTDSWEPMAVTGNSLIVLPEAGPHGGIGVADRMAVIGIEVGLPVERVSARQATRQEAQRLAVQPGAVVLAVERTHYDRSTGRPVETADIVLLGSRWIAEYGIRPEPGAP
ncbi:GntR family transcriptional regulator [Kitasatospora sp. NPDC048540]|uniref:GntR family transcriptional regulator n=1 Tax=unclassified Kitasatospora TaxID=2633591 RepID=UPI00053A9E3C|nr:GntR family transcriptional regulator [Kitasatospora sp. MBT63]